MAKDDHGTMEDAAAHKGAGPHRNLLQPADLPGEIEELREQLRQERDRHLHTLADFRNYRRRAEGESTKSAEKGKREIILPLLNIIDDLERSLRWANDEERPLADGVGIIHQKLLALLAKEGVRPFDSTGTLFTPELHEAIAVAERPDVESGTIVEELRRGYLWKKELLRAAQVRVAR
jgi:molecular chaperone GrpE